MPKDPQPNNYAFIDSQNLVASIHKLGWKMDWRKFRQFLADKYGVTKAFMFIGYIPEMQDLYEQMHEAGYMVVLKPTFDLTRPRPEDDKTKVIKEEDKKPVKGNIDADLVLWAMKELPNYDKAVIVSGDGDFYGLVEYLADKNRLEKLLVPNFYYSSLFNRYKEHIDRIDQSRRELAYHDRQRRPRRPAEPKQKQ